MHPLLNDQSISAISEASAVWSVIVAATLGAVLGLERTVAGKHAGMRTYSLVSLGSCLFVISGVLASYAFSSFVTVNPLAIAGSVIVGVGFIGTGLAVFRGEHPSELTTTAGLWVSSGVGIACAFGFYILALASVILSLGIFAVMWRLEHTITKNVTPEKK